MVDLSDNHAAGSGSVDGANHRPSGQTASKPKQLLEKVANHVLHHSHERSESGGDDHGRHRNQNGHEPAPAMPKLEYNPYGMFTRRPFELADTEKEESVAFRHATESPNKYLPDQFKQQVEDLEQKYHLVVETSDFVGSGGASSIKKVALDSNPKKIYALKKFFVLGNETPEEFYRRVSQEYVISKNMKHLHVVVVHDLVRLPVNLQRSWGIVMDCHACDLLAVIRSLKWKGTPLEEKLCYFKQISFGLKYIHELGLVHYDLKPANVLVATGGVLKIADFGCCEFVHEEPGNFDSPVRLTNSLVGTPPYQAPEVTKNRAISKEKRPCYDPFKFDYWSLGIVLYVLVFGMVPFMEAQQLDTNYQEYEHFNNLYKEINPSFIDKSSTKVPNKGKFSQNFPHTQLVRLFWRLCDPDPKTRFTLPNLFEDTYFQSLATCIDESDYECNYVRHEGYSPEEFCVEYGLESEESSSQRSSFSRTRSTRSRDVSLGQVSAPPYSSLVDMYVDSKVSTHTETLRRQQRQQQRNSTPSLALPDNYSSGAYVSKNLNLLPETEHKVTDNPSIVYFDGRIIDYRFERVPGECPPMVVPLQAVRRAAQCPLREHNHARYI